VDVTRSQVDTSRLVSVHLSAQRKVFSGRHN